MTAALPDLATWAWPVWLVFLRIGGIVALAPGFGEQSVPARVRLVIALALTLVLLPALAPGLPPPPPGFAGQIAVCGAELLVGLVFGLALRLFVLALHTAGMLAAQATSLAQLFGAGPGAEPAPAVGHLLVAGGIALAMLLDLDIRLIGYLLESYAAIPAGGVLDLRALSGAGLSRYGPAFALAVSLSAAFAVAALAYNLVLGVISRAMPQLMVTFVGAPALTAGSLILLLASAPIILATWSAALGQFLQAPFPMPP